MSGSGSENTREVGGGYVQPDLSLRGSLLSHEGLRRVWEEGEQGSMWGKGSVPLSLPLLQHEREHTMQGGQVQAHMHIHRLLATKQYFGSPQWITLFTIMGIMVLYVKCLCVSVSVLFWGCIRLCAGLDTLLPTINQSNPLDLIITTFHSHVSPNN